MKECQWLDRPLPSEVIISVLVWKARLEALLEAAGISKLAENKELADPDVIKRLTSSVRYNIRFRLFSLIFSLNLLSVLPACDRKSGIFEHCTFYLCPYRYRRYRTVPPRFKNISTNI
jgi:hypothetical protein